MMDGPLPIISLMIHLFPFFFFFNIQNCMPRTKSDGSMSRFLYHFRIMLSHCNRMFTQSACRLKFILPSKSASTSALYYDISFYWLKFPRRKMETNLLFLCHHHISVTQSMYEFYRTKSNGEYSFWGNSVVKDVMF